MTQRWIKSISKVSDADVIRADSLSELQDVLSVEDINRARDQYSSFANSMHFEPKLMLDQADDLFPMCAMKVLDGALVHH